MIRKKYISTVVYAVILPFTLILSCTQGGERQSTDRSDIIYADWKPTDSAITDVINDHLADHPDVSAHLIDVSTADGIVTLSGSTDNILAKDKAEEIVSVVKGVKGVINLIKVKVDPVEDYELEEKINKALYYGPVTRPRKIDVEVNDGNVTLEGVVNSWQQRKSAEDVVKSLKGVVTVDNNLRFKYDEDRDVNEMKADIIGLIHDDVRIDGELIEVQVFDHTAKLIGTIGSLAEKTLAVSHAWVTGIDSVSAEELTISEWARNPEMRTDKYVDRSDEEIKEAITRAFKYDYRINERRLDINVENGRVTLRGEVYDLVSKMAAGEDARDIVGVWDVINRIKVRPVEIPDNKALADNVRVALNDYPFIEKYDLRVNVYNGKAYLYGNVSSRADKNKASEITSKVPGIVDVQNNIEVISGGVYPYTYGYYSPDIEIMKEPEIKKSDARIKADIQKELWWSPFVNEDDIQIEVDKGAVTLSGRVDTETEKKHAEINAMEGGAFTVENNIIVNYGP